LVCGFHQVHLGFDAVLVLEGERGNHRVDIFGFDYDSELGNTCVVHGYNPCVFAGLATQNDNFVGATLGNTISNCFSDSSSPACDSDFVHVEGYMR
jgi:hypothetical protein